MAKVPIQVIYTYDCEEAALREPGGSIDCPRLASETQAPALEAVYSYIGQPLASDEYGSRNFTFSVYFRPDELPSSVQRSLLSARKAGRSEAAGYFAVTTYRELATRVAIDDRQSHLCEGNYSDGLWTPTDPSCKDQVSYKVVSEPSGYITVRVDPVTERYGPATR